MAKIARTSSDGVFAVLPLRDIVVFPHMIVPLFVGREKSIKALEEVMGAEKQILLATQKNAADDDPEPDAIYDVGTLANVLQLLKLPDGTVKVLVEGSARARITSFIDRAEFHEARAVVLAGAGRRGGRDRGAGALGRLRLRKLCEAQQEDLARSGWCG